MLRWCYGVNFCCETEIKNYHLFFLITRQKHMFKIALLSRCSHLDSARSELLLGVFVLSGYQGRYGGKKYACYFVFVLYSVFCVVKAMVGWML